MIIGRLVSLSRRWVWKKKNLHGLLIFAECPYAWLEIRGRCYRFNPVLKTSTAARKYCSVYDAYPVVLETVQETEELMITVSNISK